MKPERRVKCVVFDVDDTLYLESSYVESGFRAVDSVVQARLGVGGFFEAAWSAFLAGQRGTIFNVALKALACHEATDEIIPLLVAAYRSHVPEIALAPDARQAIESLDGRFRLGAVTDGPLQSQVAKVKALGIRPVVTPVVFTDALGEGCAKPSVVPFRVIELVTGFRGHECAYLADNPIKDFGGPMELGWRRIRVRRAGGLHSSIASGSDVEEEVPDLSQIEQLLIPAKK